MGEGAGGGGGGGGGGSVSAGRFYENSQDTVKEEKKIARMTMHLKKKNSQDQIDQNMLIYIFIRSQMILIEGSNGKYNIKIGFLKQRT